MCQFGSARNIFSEQTLTKEQALVGYRNWYLNNSFNEKEERHLKSLSQEFLWPKKGECKGNPSRDNSEGIYNYNNNNRNYNYYNYNNYNNYNYYNYYYYSNYSIWGKTLLYGKVFSYKEGYRSSLCIPTHLVILSDKQWFEDEKTKRFANHFNEIVRNLAAEYDCEVIGYDEYSKR